MDGSRVAQSLDSLWFYTNILTCSSDDPVPSLIDQSAPLVHAKECPKRDLQKPNTPFLKNQTVENLTPRCHKIGEISSACEEVKPGRETQKREKKKRRKCNKLELNGINFGFGVKEVGGFLKFKEESCEYQMLSTQQQTKMPPFDDDVAMKQHLKSWAYAVACTVK